MPYRKWRVLLTTRSDNSYKGLTNLTRTPIARDLGHGDYYWRTEVLRAIDVIKGPIEEYENIENYELC